MNDPTKTMESKTRHSKPFYTMIKKYAFGAIFIFSWAFVFYTFYNSRHNFEMMRRSDMMFFILLTTEPKFNESYLESYYYGKPFSIIETYRTLSSLVEHNRFDFKQEMKKSEIFDEHKKLLSIVKQRGLEDRDKWLERKYQDTEEITNNLSPVPNQSKP